MAYFALESISATNTGPCTRKEINFQHYSLLALSTATLTKKVHALHQSHTIDLTVKWRAFLLAARSFRASECSLCREVSALRQVGSRQVHQLSTRLICIWTKRSLEQVCLVKVVCSAAALRRYFLPELWQKDCLFCLPTRSSFEDIIHSRAFTEA